ncbi:hypothetical protein [Rhizobium lusitanum]|uniref:hypothetical protein n=1 Tax=Rhizobium lusitanum TaxID=293958 RepID=UPI0019572203|nr:hypothetical protein [Rhizobium lusitanum]MBM7045695.1 hypothetical protein [Rhizobium lusitanum]
MNKRLKLARIDAAEGRLRLEGDRWKSPRYCDRKFSCLIRFTEGRFVTISVDEPIASVNCHEHKRDATFPQNVCHGEGLGAGQIYVLNQLILLREARVTKIKDLAANNFFQKLAGYDTLCLVLW